MIPIHLNDLSDVILLLIFSYFTPQQLSTHLVSVCSRWHRLSRHPTVWRNLITDRISLASAIKLFRTAPLQDLSLLDCEWTRENADDLIALVSVHCPKLIDIRLGGPVRVTSESLCALADSCPDITKLTFSRVDINNPEVNFSAHFRRLETVHLVVRNLGSANVCAFNGCPSLQRVELRILGIIDPLHFVALIEQLRSVLVSLVITRDGLSLECFRAMASCAKLSSVSVFNSGGLCDQGIACLGTMTTLEKLCLNGENQVSTPGFVSVFSAEGNFLQLKELSIKHARAFNDDVLVALASNCHSLIKLKLGRCMRITDMGFCCIVTRCSNLDELELKGPKLTSACLHPIPNYLPRLRKLTLSLKGMVSPSVNELKQARPEIELCISVAK